MNVRIAEEATAELALIRTAHVRGSQGGATRFNIVDDEMVANPSIIARFVCADEATRKTREGLDGCGVWWLPLPLPRGLAVGLIITRGEIAPDLTSRNARRPEHDARALLLRMADLRRLDAHHGDAADKARSVHRHYARGRG